jgi:predicted membrane GTPase involved in stress response
MSNESGALVRDGDYLTRRESQERLAAERTSNPAVRRIHAELANNYAERLRATMTVAG